MRDDIFLISRKNMSYFPEINYFFSFIALCRFLRVNIFEKYFASTDYYWLRLPIKSSIWKGRFSDSYQNASYFPEICDFLRATWLRYLGLGTLAGADDEISWETDELSRPELSWAGLSWAGGGPSHGHLTEGMGGPSHGKVLGEWGGATYRPRHSKNKSKNPIKRSLVREQAWDPLLPTMRNM